MLMKPTKPLTLSIVVPCYNEEQVLSETIRVLTDIVMTQIEAGKITTDSFIFFVDDGSNDNTWTLIEAENKRNKRVKGLKLAGNSGHQMALLAGLEAVQGKKVDCAITLDADLQDDVRGIEKMLDAHANGNEIVYGVRHLRKTDTFLKRNSAIGFYRLMRLIGVNIVHNHSDFRLMGKKSMESILQYNETSIFLRGIIPLMGYRSECIYYDRKQREKGNTKYPLRKMLSLAWNAICSFSIAPLRFISFIGALIFILTGIMSLWVLFTKFFGNAVHGWASTLLPIYFLGGIQLLSIGVLGEYLGKIYLEVKKRPRFIKEIELE